MSKRLNLEALIASNEIKKEYMKVFLLNMFQKICVKMERNEDFKIKIRKLFRQSSNYSITIISIVKKELKYDLTIDEAEIMCEWFKANLTKISKRKNIPLSIKQDLYKKQNGKCMVCGEDLGKDWSKIHVDHIIPWKLVGDELPNNYQDLCETCNECKSARTDFIFKSMLKIT